MLRHGLDSPTDAPYFKSLNKNTDYLEEQKKLHQPKPENQLPVGRKAGKTFVKGSRRPVEDRESGESTASTANDMSFEVKRSISYQQQSTKPKLSSQLAAKAQVLAAVAVPEHH